MFPILSAPLVNLFHSITRVPNVRKSLTLKYSPHNACTTAAISEVY